MALSRPIPPATPSNADPAFSEQLKRLPTYLRSLLKIEVPVRVTLAETRKPINHITQLVPGSIIHFDKSCDETLALQVGETTIACGEAVKVGDKFGFRITSIVMPDERFMKVQRDRKKAD